MGRTCGPRRRPAVQRLVRLVTKSLLSAAIGAAACTLSTGSDARAAGPLAAPVLVRPSLSPEAAAAAVALAGGRVQLTERGVLQAEIPASGLAQLAADPAVGSVSPAP